MLEGNMMSMIMHNDDVDDNDNENSHADLESPQVEDLQSQPLD